MNEFLNFVDGLRHRMAFHLEIYYSRVMDWTITIYRKGCAELYPDAALCGENQQDVVMVEVQDPDMELCFAKAHVALKEWLLKNSKGY